MTCEVAVMNKYAVVIAADSAVTTRDASGAERYSKGGNKIFQLSNHQPVGVMIFGGAMLDGVPWEIIIKAYRERLADRSFPTLAEYSTSFFDFVKTAAQFFPQADLDKNFGDFIVASALKLLNEGRALVPIIDDMTHSEPERKTAWDTYLADKVAELRNIPFHAEIDPAACAQATATIANQIPADSDAYLTAANLQNVVDVNAWFSAACLFFFTCNNSILSGTGVVFSGFGSDQYFPEVIEYDVPGFVQNDFVFSKQDYHSCQIGHDTPSAIFQFAMTSSIDAFTQGIDVDVFTEAKRSYDSETKSLVLSLLNAANVPIPVDLDAQIATSTDAFSKVWVSKVYDLHYYPMKRVIASLPIEEMIHLAETLVVLQTLKERVTSHRQSVGGPIDVAVITKSEGLVWIKRKHFFDSDKNLRYVLRQKALAN
jgi:hypothetical protein